MSKEKVLSLEEIKRACLEDKIADLEAKLAEKEKEIQSSRTRDYITLLQMEMLELKVATQHQDKISFCIEQLEKVKETLNKTNKSGYIIQFRSMDDRLGFYKVINNQIEELKKEMK